MKGTPPNPSEEPVPYPPRMPDESVVTVDLEALVQRPFIKSLMDRVMAFQENDYGGEVRMDWKAGTYYTGVFAAHLATGEAAYRAAALAWGQAAQWKIGSRPFYADDICMAQTMLDLYLVDRDPLYIQDISRLLEEYFEKKSLTPADVHSHLAPAGEKPMLGRNLWWWCDALYMAPPVLVRMHAATGDQRYLDLLHRLYWDTIEFLFDEKVSLCFRDASFFPPDPATALERDKIFWSRGNGWVFAGLVRVLDYLPINDPFRPRYLELFQKLTRKLVTLQKSDGLWSSWLNRPDLAQDPEVSGSCFFAFGLFAGIKRGWLDRKSYLPLALRAWRGLTCKLDVNGRLGFAQLVDSAPGPVRPESSIDYTQGAFLLAASELYALNLSPADLRALVPARAPLLLMADAAWTMSNDDPAVLADEHVYLGAVNSAGRSRFLAYRINPPNAPSIFTEPLDLSAWNGRNELNNPALLRFENKLLAVYSKRDADAFWNWRIASIPEKLPGWGRPRIQWSEEKSFSTQSAAGTHADLARLSAENGRIYHFFRGDACDPKLTWSDDGAETWQPELHFINSGDGGSQPHVRYVDNGRDRIDLIFADEHPRGISNHSLYHFYYQGGAFHSSDGKVLRDMAEIAQQPLTLAEGTPIQNGSGRFTRDLLHNLEYDAKGQPVVVFISSSEGSSGGDLRYWISRWNERAGKWISQAIAHAGSRVYQDEPHSAGGITLDPENDRVLYLSSNVDPATGAPNATGRYQLFRGTLDETGNIQIWEQLTFDANRDNIRPFVPRGHNGGACVIWQRGTYRSRTNYQMDIYGIGF
ncbi:MAG: glycoside hydrolase family 88 protein [Luteolibacter sp.]